MRKTPSSARALWIGWVRSSRFPLGRRPSRRAVCRFWITMRRGRFHPNRRPKAIRKSARHARKRWATASDRRKMSMGRSPGRGRHSTRQSSPKRIPLWPRWWRSRKRPTSDSAAMPHRSSGFGPRSTTFGVSRHRFSRRSSSTIPTPSSRRPLRANGAARLPMGRSRPNRSASPMLPRASRPPRVISASSIPRTRHRI